MPNRLLHYNSRLKNTARQLRKNMTESERRLWSRLRSKQLLGVQFYRQKPIGNYIVDFYAPKVKLVIEVDGSQHAREDHAAKDEERDDFLSHLGLWVMRFHSSDVLKKTDAVGDVIYQYMQERLKE